MLLENEGLLQAREAMKEAREALKIFEEKLLKLRKLNLDPVLCGRNLKAPGVYEKWSLFLGDCIELAIQAKYIEDL